MGLGPAVLGGHHHGGPRTSCPRGTCGPRTSCPGGQLVLGPCVRGDNLRGGHPRMDVLPEVLSAYTSKNPPLQM